MAVERTRLKIADVPRGRSSGYISSSNGREGIGNIQRILIKEAASIELTKKAKKAGNKVAAFSPLLAKVKDTKAFPRTKNKESAGTVKRKALWVRELPAVKRRGTEVGRAPKDRISAANETMVTVRAAKNPPKTSGLLCGRFSSFRRLNTLSFIL
jgi:hypothetical protein